MARRSYFKPGPWLCRASCLSPMCMSSCCSWLCHREMKNIIKKWCFGLWWNDPLSHLSVMLCAIRLSGTRGTRVFCHAFSSPLCTSELSWIGWIIMAHRSTVCIDPTKGVLVTSSVATQNTTNNEWNSLDTWRGLNLSMVFHTAKWFICGWKWNSIRTSEDMQFLPFAPCHIDHEFLLICVGPFGVCSTGPWYQ